MQLHELFFLVVPYIRLHRNISQDPGTWSAGQPAARIFQNEQAAPCQNVRRGSGGLFVFANLAGRLTDSPYLWIRPIYLYPTMDFILFSYTIEVYWLLAARWCPSQTEYGHMFPNLRDARLCITDFSWIRLLMVALHARSCCPAASFRNE